MFLIITRNFPPDIGGIQTLMGGLSESLLNHGPVKVITYEYPNSNTYDSKSSINIERISGIKLFRKYRKANLVNNFISANPNIRALIADHWKSLELIKTEYFKKIKTFCLLHSKEINHEVGSSLNKRLIKSTNNADYIIANSNFTKELAIKVGINKSKINIIFPGIQKPSNIETISKINSGFDCYGTPYTNWYFFYTDDSEEEKFAILSIGKNVANLYFRIDPETFSIEDEQIRKVKGWFWSGAERRVGITSENSDLIMECVRHAYETTKKIESEEI